MTHIGTRPLETPRLRLRRLSEADAPAFFALMSDERVSRTVLFPRLTELREAEAYMVKDMEKYENEPSFYIWAIEIKESGVMAGTTSLSVESERSKVGSVGYSLRPDFWGKGYATEALRAVLAFGFKEVGFNRLEGQHMDSNPASGAVMRKAGMLYEGMMREKHLNYLGYHDAHMYGMLKRDF